MPLNNLRISDATTESIRAIPLDQESLRHCDYTYQTKVDIYDKKCGSGCEFCRIEVDCLNQIKIFNNSAEAIAYCARSGHRMERLCEYPGDIREVHNKVIYPSVTEIVVNTCQFWYDSLKEDYETEFIEVENNEYNGNNREFCSAQTVPQQKLAEFTS